MLHVGVCVGDCVGEPDRVLWVLESVVEGEGVICVDAFSAAVVVLQKLVVLCVLGRLLTSGYVVLEVLNVFAAPFPAVLKLQWVRVVLEAWVF